MPIIEITSLSHPGVELFSSLTEAQLCDKRLFEKGLFHMVETLHPHTIIVYGSANYPCFDKIKEQLGCDENVKSAEDTEKLGIMTGDIVCFDPRTIITESGYIESRFLDDKLSVGILLGLAKYLKDVQIYASDISKEALEVSKNNALKKLRDLEDFFDLVLD